MATLIDLTGKTFGRLRVLGRAANNEHGHAVWRCRCDCGETPTVRGAMLLRGDSRSCGCLRREVAAVVLGQNAQTTTGRRTVSQLTPPPHVDEPPMPGPPFVYFRALVPIEACERRAMYSPEMTAGGERHWISPKTDPVLAYWAGLACAAADQHYGHGVTDIHHAFILKFHGHGLPWHRDNEYEGCVLEATGCEPTPRILFAICAYLSDPDDYEGGELVLDEQEPSKPGLGDVIAMRGDVGHSVNAVTQGERYMLKAVVSVPASRRWEMVDGSWI